MQDDRKFISKVTETNALVTIALGFSEYDPEKVYKSAQSRKTVHCHINPPAPDKPFGTEALITPDIQHYDLENSYISLVDRHYRDYAAFVVAKAFTKSTDSNFTLSHHYDTSKQFDPYSIELNFPEGISLTDTLVALSRIYESLQQVWDCVTNPNSDPKNSNRLISVLQKSFRDSTTAPIVPSYNVITHWNESDKISKVSIAPSQRGPAERTNKKALVRVRAAN